MEKIFVKILIDLSHQEVDRLFHYKLPEKFYEKIQIGMRVLVPFGNGNKIYEGFVMGLDETTEYPEEKIKTIVDVRDSYPLFNEDMLQLALWMQKKYFTTLINCINCIIPSGLTMEKKDLTHRVNYAYLNYDLDNFTSKFSELTNRSDSAQSKVLKLLKEKGGLPLTEIKACLQISFSPINTLQKKGLIIIKSTIVRRNPFIKGSFMQTKSLELNAEQKIAVSFIHNKLEKNDLKPVLIHGVTGSGKTEIYLQVIEEVLKKGKQVIVLVPEISLTPQAVEIFIGRFSDKISVTHSRLSVGERFDQWERARQNEISIMIGPRSAIFTPFDNLGLIIIDEEHENTYKSETSPKYCTKEIAIKLSELTGALVVLGSATPSIESYFLAENKIYDLLVLKERVNKTFPETKVIDMREELATGNRSMFSRDLIYAIQNCIENKEQIILFLNRRGHSTFVSCRSCGYVMTCDDCSVNYTYHINNDTLVCHYCGKTTENPSNCPQCGSQFIKYFGVGTQKIQEEILKLYPDVKALRMDMDTTSKKSSHEKLFQAFKNGEAQILIGTQMVAKGLDFPKVTLVGIIAADVALNVGDFRSAETTFQLITQVSGRAGRASIKGKVFIQTYNPEHYSIVYAQKNAYEDFYKHEIALRRQMLYPPYTKIFYILFTGLNEKRVITMLFKLLDIMNFYNRKALFDIIGPAPAIISKIKNNYRWKMIVKSVDEEKLKNFVLFCINSLKEKENLKDITMNLTINPTMG